MEALAVVGIVLLVAAGAISLAFLIMLGKGMSR
jgi:hypothetical protein